MADADFREERLREILDQRKKQWRIIDCVGVDPDQFNVEFVLPLRQLHYEGWFDEYKETKNSIRGVLFVNAFYIISPINYLAGQEQEQELE
jgi:hypothetical protein